MNLLTMEHITKSYTDRVLLDDVDFGINENEKIGIIGLFRPRARALPPAKYSFLLQTQASAEDNRSSPGSPC